MKAVALDMGSKRVGIAVSDSDGRVAMPSDHFSRSKDAAADFRALARRIDDLGAEVVVAGIPLPMAGELSAQALTILRELGTLAEHLVVPLLLWDERFTSKMAEGLLREAGVSARDARAKVDSAAAALLLQDWLDSPVREDAPAVGSHLESGR